MGNQSHHLPLRISRGRPTVGSNLKIKKQHDWSAGSPNPITRRPLQLPFQPFQWNTHRCQGTIMEEIDFEQRRELRRQKREEMRLEAERVTETVSSSYGGGGGDDEEQALQERMSKREERRQRRMKEALERQRQLDPTVSEDNDHVATEKNNAEEERPSSWRRGRYRDNEDEEEKTEMYSSRREEKEREEPREEEEAAPEGGEEAEEGVDEEEEQKVEVVEDKPRRSYLREQESTEEPKIQNKELAEEETHSVVSESSNQAKATNSEAEEDAVASEEAEEVNERGGAREEREEQGKQNGGLYEEAAPKQHRKPERTLSRGSVRSPEASAGDDQDDAARLEAERKLEELKRRRDDAESEEFERMRQKQQEAEAELEELKRKREERRKVLEEEERQKKQEEAEKKAREEEEKRKMKEEIERRRAEAAEKRQKVEDTMDGEDRPFKCVSPRGSSLKIGERAEFLNKSAQKSTVKMSHSPAVSKIDNRLEQYTSAAQQRENKESRSPRSGAVDLPMVTDGIRNIKSMWEKGNVFTSPGGGGSTFKEAAVMKTGVAGRINDWLNKTPERAKTSGERPADLKPVDVTNKRSLWENKGASPTKVAGRGETKSVANGMGH
ncbi:caldesmon 1a isoform X6 [Siniperca chuatsi]|uniref:caldesmon 1a isoform X6 n=2 Tax=Siniperca chuatsi TaxID=119488 RepID=UPI001CE1AA36|nr:caldesmon 1a isoform X6 [Siniperca chuatsi]